MLNRICDSILCWVKSHPRISFALAISFFCVYSFGLVVAGVAGGMVVNERGYHVKIQKFLKGHVAELLDRQKARWFERNTGLHKLEYARVHIGNALGQGGGLAEVEGKILFVSSKGRFGYLDEHNRIQSLDLTVPMNLEALRQSPNYTDPLSRYNYIRVTDILVAQTKPRNFVVYAAHHYFKPECMQFKVSSIDIEVDEKGIKVTSPKWREVFVARPRCIRHKDRSFRFVGDVSGGRLVQFGEDSLLLSIGDHHFDGFNDAWVAAMDPQTDLGKIIKINLRTGQSRVYAKGVRNPQGLTVTRDGRIWETEHGPVGGDEVNLIRDGANYGWPYATYGMNYGYPSRNWPLNPIAGAHEGYDLPAFVFVPSVGISNIVEPDLMEFPNWRNSLIAASMRGNKLFLLRVEGDRIVYAEPIDTDGDRVRDIISRQNGQLVYLSDKGDLIFLRNAERHKAEPREFTVSIRTPLSEPFAEEHPPRDMPPVARGRHMFMNACANCHALNGEIGVGPPLNGVVGRKVGAIPGYGYSQALAKYDGNWSRDLLRSFLTDPDQEFHGTTMPIAPISWMEVPNVISFMGTTRAGTVK